jgi:hypothetical protein
LQLGVGSWRRKVGEQLFQYGAGRNAELLMLHQKDFKNSSKPFKMAVATRPKTTITSTHPKDSPYQLDPDQVCFVLVPERSTSNSRHRLSKPPAHFCSMSRPKPSAYNRRLRNEISLLQGLPTPTTRIQAMPTPQFG